MKIFLISLKDKNVNAKENKKDKKKKAYQKSFCIAKTRNDLIDEITDQGYIVSYDPPGDGNYQFLALCDFLLNCKILRPHKQSGKRL